MNAPAHITPVVYVIDPLSEPSDPRRVEYGIPVAFGASGAILPQMPGLTKLQRSQTFADMEDTIRAEMEEEKYRARRIGEAKRLAQIEAARTAAAQATRDRAEKRRQAATAQILKAIHAGHKTAAALSEATGFSATALDTHLRRLRAAGVVKVWMQRNHRGLGGSHNVYEVAQ